MKKTFLTHLRLFLSVAIVNGQISLQEITDKGNTTNNALFINGSGKYNIGSYSGLMLYYYSGAGYVDAFNPGIRYQRK